MPLLLTKLEPNITATHIAIAANITATITATHIATSLLPVCYTLTLQPSKFTSFRLKSKTTPRACHDIRQRMVGAMRTMWMYLPCLAL